MVACDHENPQALVKDAHHVGVARCRACGGAFALVPIEGPSLHLVQEVRAARVLHQALDVANQAMWAAEKRLRSCGEKDFSLGVHALQPARRVARDALKQAKGKESEV